MQGYRLTNTFVGEYCYSVSRPPSGGEPCELPANVTECFARRETSNVEIRPGYVLGKCPLHCVFVDRNGDIVDKSYLYA